MKNKKKIWQTHSKRAFLISSVRNMPRRLLFQEPNRSSEHLNLGVMSRILMCQETRHDGNSATDVLLIEIGNVHLLPPEDRDILSSAQLSGFFLHFFFFLQPVPLSDGEEMRDFFSQMWGWPLSQNTPLANRRELLCSSMFSVFS
jgi:hypothetical protein